MLQWFGSGRCLDTGDDLADRTTTRPNPKNISSGAGHCLVTHGEGGGFGALASPGRPTDPPTSQKVSQGEK